MKQKSKAILIFCSISSMMLLSYADRGIRSKSRNNVVLNINTNKNTTQTQLNFKKGTKQTNHINSNLIVIEEENVENEAEKQKGQKDKDLAELADIEQKEKLEKFLKTEGNHNFNLTNNKTIASLEKHFKTFN